MKLAKRVLAFGAAFSLCAAMAVSSFALDPAAAAVNQQQAYLLMQQGDMRGALTQCEQGIKNLEGATGDDLLYQQFSLYLMSSNLRFQLGQFQAAVKDESQGNQILAQINIDNLSYLSAEEKASMKEMQSSITPEDEDLSDVPEAFDSAKLQGALETYESMKKWPAIGQKMLSDRKAVFQALSGYISIGTQGVSVTSQSNDELMLFSQPVQIDIEGDLSNRGCIHIKAPAGTKVANYVSMTRNVSAADFEKYYIPNSIDNDENLEITVEAGKDYELIPLADDSLGYWSMVVTGV